MTSATSVRLRSDANVADAEVADDLMLATRLLFEHGDTTRQTIEAGTRLAAALGTQATLLLRFGEVTVRVDCADGAHHTVAESAPLGVDIGTVLATRQVVDAVGEGRIGADGLRDALLAAGRAGGVSVARFAILAGAGAAALGVIFGATDWPGLLLIALSAGLGACLRRWLEHLSTNRFIQPLCAALMAGIVGAVAINRHLSPGAQLVAVCPCMVLVPGPHLLNGLLDLARARLALGGCRIFYACITIIVICTGLLAGLALGGASLPAAAPSLPVPLAYDVLSAGVAVAAYGTFFAMPWRLLPIPVMIGMAAHAAHWAVIALGGGSVVMAALVACALVGLVATPIADRWRLPFAAFAFASVVSLIPGVFLFRTASGLVMLVGQGGAASPALLLDVVAQATTALLIMLAMGFGLIVPKMLIEYAAPGLIAEQAGPRRHANLPAVDKHVV